jgi:hypothetical protein
VAVAVAVAVAGTVVGVAVAGGPATTVVPAVAVLFAGNPSDEVLTVAELLRKSGSVVGAPGAVTAIVMVAEPDAAMIPRFPVTVPFVPTGGPLQLPWLVMHETRVVPGGSGSVTVARHAASGPPLETVSV